MRGRAPYSVPRGVRTNGTNGAIRMSGSDSLCSDSAGTELPIQTAAAGVYTGDIMYMYPGKTTSTIQFPRLNAIASLYSQFRWVACSVRYKPTCGTTTPGRVVMSASYDPKQDIAPTSVRQQLETIPHVNTMAYRGATLVVPCGRNNFQFNWYPVGQEATVPIPDNEYIPFVVTVGSDSGDVGAVGFIEVDWVIEFKDPINPTLNPDN